MQYNLPTTEQILPYSYEDIKFPVNRISDNATFNSKVKMLNDNLDALIGFATIVDNNLPLSYEGIYSFDPSSWTTPPTYPSPNNHNYIDIQVVEKYTGEYIFICATKNKIDLYISDINSGLSTLVATMTYTQIKDRGQQNFKNIKFIKYNNEKLYVYDSVWQSIMVYNMIPFLNDDVSISSIKFLKQFFKLKEIKNIDFKNDTYGITNNKIIKYNTDFNVKSEYILIKENPIDIITSDKIFILYEKSVHIYDYFGNKISEFDLLLFDDEVVLNITPSKTYSDILYIQSKKYIYKYTSDGVFMGWFNNGDTMGGLNFTSIDIMDFDNKDQIFALDENKLHFFIDNINTILLYDKINMLDIEELSNLTIKDLELEQDIVYNSVIQKILFNNLLLYNSLLYKAMLVTDEKGVLTYSHKENLVNVQTINVNPIFYGQNEIFSFQTFNRVVKEIYDIQLKILDLLEFDITENSTNTLII